MKDRHSSAAGSLDDASADEGGFSRHDETGPRDPRFRFSLRLPARWRPLGRSGESPTGRNPIACLARYAPVDEPGAEVVVTARLLAREVAPADVLQIELERSGEQILDLRPLDSPDGRSIDVLSRRRTGSGDLVLRRSAVKQANRMLILKAAATAESYDRWAERLAVIAAGLRFLQPGRWHCAEALGTLSRRRPSDFLLFYPESWRLEEPVAVSPGLLSACLVNKARDRTAGRMDLAVASRAALPGPHALADGYFASLCAAGFEGPGIRLTPSPAPAAFHLAWEGIGEAATADFRAEVRVRVGERPEAFFCFALLGPTRESAPDVWAVNRRALELAFDLVATPDVPMQGWIAEAIERSRRPPAQASPRSSARSA